jgi:uncharacterized protein (DUF885 family)
MPALQGLHDFFTQTYIPASRETLGARSLPGGEDFYRALVRQHTTLDLTPEEVHQTGLAEVARIRADMEVVIEQTGFEGSFAEFLELPAHRSAVLRRDRARADDGGVLPVQEGR